MHNWPLWLWWTGAASIALAGAVLLGWALFRDRSRGRRRCPKCWYDMSGLAESPTGGWVCPECGPAIARERRMRKTRRRWRGALTGLALGALGIGAPAREQVLRDGWLSFVPTRVLYELAFTKEFESNDAIGHELLYRRFSAGSLSDSQRASLVGNLIDRLSSVSSSRQRLSVVMLLGQVGGRDPRVTPALLSALIDPDVEVCIRIIRNLGHYYANADSVIPVLIRIAADTTRDSTVREEALNVLSLYGELAKSAEPIALAGLKDPASNVRAAAANVIGSIGADPGTAVPLLLGMLRPAPNQALWDDETSLWRAVTCAISRFPQAAPEAVPLLCADLQTTSDAMITQDLLFVLGAFGKDAAAAVPELQNKANDPEERSENVVLARCALLVINGKEPSLAIALAHEVGDLNSPYRRDAQSALRRMGDETARALPEILAQMAVEMDPFVLERMCQTLWMVNGDPDSSLSALRVLQSRWPEWHCSFAIEVIERR